MNQKRQIITNAIMSVVQIMVISAVLFILYRFLLNTIGIEQLGVWALVCATTAVTQIANLGFSGSIVKFVAKYVAREENENVSAVIQTAALSVAAFVGFVLLIGYPIAKWLLILVVPDTSLSSALSILPYALFALWLMVITSIFQAGLDGFQRIDQRCLLLMGGAIIHLFVCFMLAPTYGLMGVAYARVTQNVIILLLSWILLKRYLPLLPVFPYKWNRSLFNEIFGYGTNFQIISVTAMLYDPITKALVSKFGGLSMVGYYEMASRMIYQVRSLIVSPNQVLVPVIADLHEREREAILVVYKDSYRLLLYIALPFFSFIMAFTPIISELWIGFYENTFVLFSMLLAIGWLLNLLNAPAYVAYLGIGKLRFNTLSHIVIGLLNAGLGLALGLLYGGTGVIVGWVFSLAFGSFIICISFHLKHGIPLWELLPRQSIGIGSACLAGLFTSLLLYYLLHYHWHLAELSTIILLTIFAVEGIPAWNHPMRKRLLGWFTNELMKKKKEMKYVG